LRLLWIPSRLRADMAGKLRPDLIDALTGIVNSARPYSWRSAMIALVSLVLATCLRAAFGATAAHFPLTFFMFAILVVELLAGFPAALAVTASSVLIVWYAFIEPYFQFSRVNAGDFMLMLLFITEAGAAMLIGYWCRVALIRLHKHQAAYRTIAQELAHRNKNSLAMFEAVVKKTLAEQPKSAETIIGRLRALSKANDLLIESGLQAISFSNILESEFSPYDRNRVDTRGPDVTLHASAARHLFLIIHELVTNAAKYGALSAADGRVKVTWLLSDSRLKLRWSEEGGPPVRAPEREGFGSLLIRESARALGGMLKSEFREEGFACSLSFVFDGEAEGGLGRVAA
jgi:two-component sensor histidine kinase